MTTMTATMDVLETIRGHATTGISVENSSTPTPVVIATTADINRAAC